MRVIQRVRPNLPQLRQHFRFVLGTIDQEEAQADGLNLVPILLCVNAQDQKRGAASAEAAPFAPVFCILMLAVMNIGKDTSI